MASCAFLAKTGFVRDSQPRQPADIGLRIHITGQRQRAWRKATWAIARAFARRGDEAAAMAAFGGSIEVGGSYYMDSIYTPLVEWHIGRDDLSSAERLVRSIGSVRERLNPVKIIATARAMKGDIDGAMALLDRTVGKMPSSAMFAAKVEVLVAAKKYDDATKLARDAPNGSGLLLLIAKARAGDGDVHQAIVTLSPMRGERDYEKNVAELIAPLARAGKIDQAQELMESLSDRFHRGYAEARIVEGLVAQGRLQEAENRFLRIAGPPFNDNAGKALAEAYLEAGNADSAHRYLEVLIPSTKLDLFLEMARKRLALNDRKQFSEYMHDARKAADSKEVNRRGALLSMMILHAEAGDFAAAKAALDDLAADYSFSPEDATPYEMGNDRRYSEGKERLRRLRSLARAFASSPERRRSLLAEIEKLTSAEERCAAYLGGAESFAPMTD